MKKRILSSILILVVLTISLLVSKEVFAIIIALSSCFCLKELIKVRDKENNYNIINFMAYLSVFLIVCNGTIFKINTFVMVTFPILVFLMPLAFCDNKKYNIIDAIYMMGITFFLGVSFYIMVNLRSVDVYKVLYIFVIAFITDTYAFIGGKLIGRYNFSTISPSKTVEGIIIGIIMGSVIGSVYYYLVIGDLIVLETILLSLGLTIFSEIGDLVFSSIKRHFGKKDYSDLIPGHGGLLDRFDSIIFTLLGYMFIFNLF